jgi:thiol-disulfide isomerase/thioredoxin
MSTIMRLTLYLGCLFASLVLIHLKSLEANPQTLPKDQAFFRACESLPLRFRSEHESLLRPERSEILMAIDTTKNVIDGFNEEGEITGWSRAPRHRWWELFNFQHILSFGEDPREGLLKDFSFRLVFYGFDFSDENLDRKSIARDRVCAWLEDFIRGNQHEHIQGNLDRTEIEIDLFRDLNEEPEILTALESRGDLGFVSPLVPSLPALLIHNGISKGGIFDGSLSLSLERKRIEDLLSSDTPSQELLRRSNLSLFQSYAYHPLQFGDQTTTVLAWIDEQAASYAKTHLIAPLDLQRIWELIFLRIYDEFPDFRANLRASLLDLTTNQGDPWMITQIAEIGKKIAGDFSPLEAKQFQAFLDLETTKQLGKNPVGVSVALRKSLSYNLDGRLTLKQVEWPDENFQKLHSIRYNFCIIDCGANFEEFLLRHSRIVQLYGENRGSRFRPSTEQFSIFLNEWYEKESPRSPFQELHFVLKAQLGEPDFSEVELHTRMPLIFAGLGNDIIQHDGFIELARVLEVSVSSLPFYIVSEIVRKTELAIEAQKIDSRRASKLALTDSLRGVSPHSVQKINSQRLHPGTLVADVNEREKSSSFYLDVLARLEALSDLNQGFNQLVKPENEAFWAQDICRPKLYQEAGFKLNELMTCFAGKVVVVSIGAPWCFPCKQAAPISRNIYQNLQSAGLVVLNFQAIDETEVGAAISNAKFDYRFPSVLLSQTSQVELGLRESPTDLRPTSLSRSLSLPAYFYRDSSGVWRYASIGGTLDLGILEGLLLERDPNFDLSKYLTE